MLAVPVGQPLLPVLGVPLRLTAPGQGVVVVVDQNYLMAGTVRRV